MQEFKNFLNDPNAIRSFALTQDYRECDFLDEKSIFSGLRSRIHDINIINEITSKIQNVVSNEIEELLSITFHVNPDVSMLGYPHYDSDPGQSTNLKKFASIIYLNDNVDYRNVSVFGTAIYKNISKKEIADKFLGGYRSEMQVVYDINIPPSNATKRGFADKCVNFKSSLKELKNFDLEYNKLVIYNASQFHSPNHYFGETIEDSRLTIAIHGTFKNDLDEDLYRPI
ncbi:hypothetical protein EBS02_00790 [bacterium]|nr:hypothetical protein [bacterium]